MCTKTVSIGSAWPQSGPAPSVLAARPPARLVPLFFPRVVLVDFALKFTLAHPDVSTAIIGTTNVDHLKANAAITDDLDNDLIEAAKSAWTELFG